MLVPLTARVGCPATMCYQLTGIHASHKHRRAVALEALHEHGVWFGGSHTAYVMPLLQQAVWSCNSVS